MVLASTAALLAVATQSHALEHHARPDWMINLGYGMGRGTFDDQDETVREYRNGAVPVIRLGRMVGDHFQVNVAYQGWVIELGDLPVKYRRSLQHFGAGVSLFPGRSSDATGGIYLRGGVGMGWTGTAEVEIQDDEEQGHGERKDEWGVSVVGEGGYEFWLTNYFTAGVGGSFYYAGIDESLVKAGWFSALTMNFNLYF